MQETLDSMIDEPQSEAIRIKNVYTLSTIRDILTEVDPGLVLECCKILQKRKKMNIEMM